MRLGGPRYGRSFGDCPEVFNGQPKRMAMVINDRAVFEPLDLSIKNQTEGPRQLNQLFTYILRTWRINPWHAICQSLNRFLFGTGPSR